MTYIRLTDGRDRGHVKEMPFDEAQAMLGNGQAVPVNFNEPDPLGFRECSNQPSAISPQPEKPLGEVPVLAAHEPPPPAQNARETASKASAGRFKRR